MKMLRWVVGFVVLMGSVGAMQTSQDVTSEVVPLGCYPDTQKMLTSFQSKRPELSDARLDYPKRQEEFERVTFALWHRINQDKGWEEEYRLDFHRGERQRDGSTCFTMPNRLGFHLTIPPLRPSGMIPPKK